MKGMKPDRMITLTLAAVVAFLTIFPANILATDAARIEGEVKENGIHFSDGSTKSNAIGLPKDTGAWSSSVLYSAGNVVQVMGSL